MEYSVSTPEQRRSTADMMAQELHMGASVLGIVPITFESLPDGVMQTIRVAVYYSDWDETSGEGELIATASVEEASPVVEEITQMKEDYQGPSRQKKP